MDRSLEEEKLDVTTFADAAKGFTRIRIGDREYLQHATSDLYEVGVRDFTAQVNGYWNPDPTSEIEPQRR